MTAPLRHLVRRAETVSPNPPLLLLLHGYGSNEEDLFSLESAFDPGFTVVSARAPLAMGPGSYAWFPLAFSEEGPIVLDPAQAESSRQKIIELIAWCAAELGTDPRRAILAGFSQGAILASGVALTNPEAVKAAVAMNGRILPEFLDKTMNVPQPPKYLVIHGVYDNVLPIAHGRATNETLMRLGLNPEYHEFAMAHQITDESLDLVTTWVKQHAEL